MGVVTLLVLVVGGESGSPLDRAGVLPAVVAGRGTHAPTPRPYNDFRPRWAFPQVPTAARSAGQAPLTWATGAGWHGRCAFPPTTSFQSARFEFTPAGGRVI